MMSSFCGRRRKKLTEAASGNVVNPQQQGVRMSVRSSRAQREAAIRLLVAFEDQLLRESIIHALGEVPSLEVVGMSGPPLQSEEQIRRARPAVTVLGPFGLGRMSMAAAQPLVEATPSCRFVFIVERLTWAIVRRATDAGALGIVPLTASLVDLVTAIRGAASGYLTVEREALEPAGSPARELSQREQLILQLTAQCLPINEIAERLFLSPGTVRNHTSALIKKLGARNRHEAARLAAEQGFL